MFFQGDEANTPPEYAETDRAASAATGDAGATSDAGGGPVMNPQKDFAQLFEDVKAGNWEDATGILIVKILIPAGLTLLAIIVAYLVAKMLARWVANSLCKRVDQTFGRFAGKFTFYTLFLIFALAIMQQVGVPITSFAAILAAAGFAIGLAFQGTLSNFASGILLLVFRPFKVGDVINAAGVTGKVNEIDLFTTTLDTPDNRRLIVPNSAISGATIENVSFHEHRRVDVVVGVGYGAPLDQTRAALSSAAESIGEKTVQGAGRGYQIVLGELGASSVDWTVRVWVNSADFWGVKEELTAAIKNALDAQGLDIPYPQMEIHVADAGEDVDNGTDDDNLLNSGTIRPRPRSS
ncbi:MAG TPA: mechanosensitive ion channel protein [Planctomycetaceae bacterium]|nr:mechanosensitive ion channel protein [Planctomycetaceae bacterium]